MDTYLTLASPSQSQFTEKRSRFLAFALPVQTENEAKECVAQYKKKYYDARHVCYAYVIGDDGATTLLTMMENLAERLDGQFSVNCNRTDLLTCWALW